MVSPPGLIMGGGLPKALDRFVTLFGVHRRVRKPPLISAVPRSDHGRSRQAAVCSFDNADLPCSNRRKATKICPERVEDPALLAFLDHRGCSSDV